MCPKLSKCHDDRLLQCKGKLAGSVGQFACPLTISLYGPHPDCDAVGGTIEDNVLGIQQDKRKLMRLAFGEKKGKRDKVETGRLADIQRLLQ
jgi:hypothetical protein